MVNLSLVHSNRWKDYGFCTRKQGEAWLKKQEKTGRDFDSWEKFERFVISGNKTYRTGKKNKREHIKNKKIYEKEMAKYSAKDYRIK